MSATKSKERTRCRTCGKFVQTEYLWVQVEEFVGDTHGKAVKTNHVIRESYCETCGDWAVSVAERMAEDAMWARGCGPRR